MPLLLDESVVRSLLPMDDLISTMSEALARFSLREVAQPLRTIVEITPQKAFFGVMPAYIPDFSALGTKLVTVFPRNIDRGLPSHLATILLLDPDSGALVALMDGRYITEARTAAVSAVSVKHLAREDADVLAIVGSGVQARSHLEAIAHTRPLREVRIWSRTDANVRRFIEEMQPSTAARIRPCHSPMQAVEDAGIVVLVTGSPEPVISAEWIADGTHVCAVGACRPTHREMDAALVHRGELYVDSREGALHEAGDIVLALEEGAITDAHIRAELGEVVAGRATGRTSPETVTIFKSLGMAVEDVAAAHLVYSRAVERQVGIPVNV